MSGSGQDRSAGNYVLLCSLLNAQCSGPRDQKPPLGDHAVGSLEERNVQQTANGHIRTTDQSVLVVTLAQHCLSG